MVGVYEEDFPTWKSPVTDNGYMKPGVASEERGGPKGQAATNPGLEIGRRDPPTVVTLRSLDHFVWPLAACTTMSRPATTRGLVRSCGGMLQGNISWIFAADASMGDCDAPEAGFPSDFPPNVEDFGPSHRSVVIEPTACGQHRQPRHNRGSRPPRGGRSHGISKGV